MEDRNEVISMNLADLVECTYVSVELILLLYERKLITKSEHQYLMQQGLPDYEKATKLYTDMAKKWDDAQYRVFLQSLQDSLNIRAYEILTSSENAMLSADEVDSLNEEMNYFREQMIKNRDATYEGISIEDKHNAGAVQANFNSGKINLENNLDRVQNPELISQIRKFITGLKQGTIWSNPFKTKLPNNYITRVNASKLATSEEKIILLVDESGMGKTCALTQIESDIRSKLQLEKGLIIIINLAYYIKILQQGVRNISLSSFISSFASYIPLDLIRQRVPGNIQVFILLDGLDEVLPTLRDALLRLIRGISGAPDGNLNLKKLVIAMKPKWMELIQAELSSHNSVVVYSLDPISVQGQIDYLVREVNQDNFTEVHCGEILEQLQQTVRDSLSNPLFLHIFSQICKKVGDFKALDIYALLSRYVENKQEIMVRERDHQDNNLESFLPCYNYLALHDVLNEVDAKIVCRIDGKSELFQRPDEKGKEELQLHGIIKLINDKLMFKHSIFPNYFYARMLKDTGVAEHVKDYLYGLLKDYDQRIAQFVPNDSPEINQIIKRLNWIWVSGSLGQNCKSLVRFTNSTQFSTLANEFFCRLITGNHAWKKLVVLLDKRSKKAFDSINAWMIANKDNEEYVRSKLLKGEDIVNENSARLILGVSSRCFPNRIFSEKEFDKALKMVGRNSSIVQVNQTLQKKKAAYTYQIKLDSSLNPYLIPPPTDLETENSNRYLKKIESSSIPGRCSYLVFPEHNQTTTGYIKHSFPSLYEFVSCATASYETQDVEKVLPQGWKLLDYSTNRSWIRSNGCYGAAYVNELKKKIILPHQATQGFCAWITNFVRIGSNFNTPSVNSAIKFAHSVNEHAKENRYEIFFTGHSLECWLGQVTLFTTIYMERFDRNTLRHRRGPYENCIRPFTVSFDPPGAYEYIDKLKLKYYPLEERVNINLETKSRNRCLQKPMSSSILGRCRYLVFPKENSTTPGCEKFSFPSLYELVKCAATSYEAKDVDKSLPSGWQLISSASNRSWKNGYYGAAYVNQTKKQIIVSHQGTRGFFTRGWITNILSIGFKFDTPRVISAITFAHSVNEYAKANGYEIFFTGHSLGGWLAQVTCFTTTFMESVDSNTLQHKTDQYKNSIRPFTISFDSPGAYEYIDKLKLKYFPLEERVHINLETLPCETYMFHPNLVNMHNYKIGSQYQLDLGYKWWRQVFALGFFTHTILEPVKAIKENGDKAVSRKLRDYRPASALTLGFLFLTICPLLSPLGILRILLPEFMQPPFWKTPSWTFFSILLIQSQLWYRSLLYLTDNQIKAESGFWKLSLKLAEKALLGLAKLHPTATEALLTRVRALITNEEREDCPWNRTFHSRSFFNEEELDFLDKNYYTDEELELLDKKYFTDQELNLLDENNFTDEELSTTKYFPEKFEGVYREYEEDAIKVAKLKIGKDIRSTTHCEWKSRLEFIPLVRKTVRRMNEKSLWVNENKAKLPKPYIERFVEESGKKVSLLQLVQKEDFVLIVGEPGMGKSSEMTKLEQDLRKSLTQFPRIILRINLNGFRDELNYLQEDNKINFKSLLDVAKGLNNIYGSILNDSVADKILTGQYPLILLLDGLDEVCPDHEATMISILEALLYDQHQGDKEFVSLKVVLSTRPHLKEIIEKKFNVQGRIIFPLSEEEQAKYLIMSNSGQEINSEAKASDVLNRLPNRSLMENPLLLKMYSVVIRNKQMDFKDLNLFTLYEHFLKNSIKEQIRKDKAHRQDLIESNVDELIEDHTPFYNYVALLELFNESTVGVILDLDKNTATEKNSERIFKTTSERKTNVLLHYGLVVMDQPKILKFKHRSLAEFSIAKIMVKKVHQEMKNLLFAVGYEYGKNIAEFVTSAYATDPKTIVTNGWTEFIPELRLSRYQGKNEKFIHGIFRDAFDYEHDKRVAELILSDGGELLFGEWLKLNRDFGRKNVFCVRNGKVTRNMVQVMEKLLFSLESNKALIGILTNEEIRDSISHKSEQMVDRAGEWLGKALLDINFNTNTLKEQLEIWINNEGNLRDILKKAVASNGHPIAFKIFTDNNLAWWLMKSLKETLNNLVLNYYGDSYTIMRNLQNILRTWGEEFLPTNLHPLKNMFSYRHGNRVLDFHTADTVYNEDQIWEQMLNNIECALKLMKEGKTFRLVRWIEESVLKLLEPVPTDHPRAAEIEEQQGIVRKTVRQAVNQLGCKPQNLEDLQYYLAYERPNREIMETVLHQARLVETYNSFVNACDAARFLLLSALVGDDIFKIASNWLRDEVARCEGDMKNEDYKLQRLDHRSESEAGSKQIQLKMLKILLKSNEHNLKATIENCLGPRLESKTYLLGEINVWQVLVSLLTNQTTEEKEFARQFLICCLQDLLHPYPYKLAELLSALKELSDTEEFQETLLSLDVVTLVIARVRDCWCNRRLFKLNIRDLLLIYKNSFSDYYWTHDLATCIPVEILEVAKEIDDEEFETEIADGFRHHFKPDLSYIFEILSYTLENDWLILLESLGSKLSDRTAVRPKMYQDPAAPLLRVWMHVFEKERTIAEASQSGFWRRAQNRTSTGELLHVAIELESIEGVRESAWPGTVTWRNENKQNALEFSRQLLGHNHEVTKFLDGLMKPTLS